MAPRNAVTGISPRESVFLDTWALIALANADDRWHAAASRINTQLLLLEVSYYTTVAVLTEVGDTLYRRGFRAVAIRILEDVLASRQLGRVAIDEVDIDTWSAAFEFYATRPDQDWSLTDCISFIVMRRQGITRAFTGDRHFEQAGFVRLLEA